MNINHNEFNRVKFWKDGYIRYVRNAFLLRHENRKLSFLALTMVLKFVAEIL